MSSALLCSHITVDFDGTRVLDDVTWEITSGERWVVLGPNGAGKTTLLRIAALYQHPTSGTVDVLGQRLGRCDVRTLREQIAFSSPALAARLEPSMTATEVVMTARYAALAPWWHQYTDDDRKRARDLLDRFGCAALADHRLPTLSAGERQRVLLARTLMTDPALVLFDEPTAGLDVGGREELVADLAKWAADKDGPPIVLVTHHVEEIPPGFTDALVMKDGKVAASGTLAETVTSEVLSVAFGLPLEVQARNGRFTATLRVTTRFDLRIEASGHERASILPSVRPGTPANGRRRMGAAIIRGTMLLVLHRS